MLLASMGTFIYRLIWGLVFCTSLSWGFSFNRNEAHLDWKVVETAHFRFYYDENLESVAEYVAMISENMVAAKIERYQLELPGKVEFIIRDDIIANGWANAYQNTMNIWVTDWEIPLRSTHNWLKDVITHEFAHIISIRSGSKFNPSVFGLVFGYQDYFNEDIQSSLTTLVPFTSQPNWFAEGVAQYESELSGYDSWDSHRDMILRTAVLNDSLLDYGRMGTFAGKGLHYEQGPYTQGFAFVKHLAEKYGDEVILKLWKENSKLHRQTLSGSLKKLLGKSGPELWQEWSVSLKEKYQSQTQQIGDPRMGEKLTKHSFFNHYPRFDASGENIYVVSNKGKQGFRSYLYKYQLADSVKEEEKMKFVSARVGSYFDVYDSTFFYSSTEKKDKNGIAKRDIFSTNLLRKQAFFSIGEEDSHNRLSVEQNAIHPDYHKASSKITFVRSELSNFYLCTALLSGGGEVLPKSLKTIFPGKGFLKGKFGFNIYTPRFSPDGKQILFSYYDGLSRKIGLINSDGSEFKKILDRPFVDRDPVWHPDGKSFLFTSDSTGIFNVYVYNLDNGRMGGVTNVIGGAFSPALSPDGKDLAYVNYDKDGFSLYLLKDWSPMMGSPVVKQVKLPDTSAMEPIEFSGNSLDYLGIPRRWIVQPLLIGQELTSQEKNAKEGASKWLAGASVFVNDPLNKNEVAVGGLVELSDAIDKYSDEYNPLHANKESELFLNYWNHSLPVSVGVGLFRKNLATFDTIRIQDGDGPGQDAIEISKQAVVLSNMQASLKYNLFDTDVTSDPLKSSFLSLTFGRAVNSFNFYDIPFSFPFYRSHYMAPTLWYYGVAPSSKSLVAPKGMAAFAAYSLNYAELFRGGTFRETFEFDDGVLSPIFNDFTLHEMDIAVDYGFGVPWSKNSSLRASTSVGSLLSWEKTSGSGADTLNSFFERGLFLRGYPYLENAENVLMRGSNTLLLGLDYNQVLVGDIFKTWWIFFLEDIYAQVFYDAGRAWNGKLYHTRIFDFDYWDESQKENTWRQTVGWGLKLNSRIYHNYPFNVFFESATARDRIRTSEGKLEKVEYVDVFGIPTYATKISLGITFGFYNGLLSGKKTGSHASHSKSKLLNYYGR